MKSAVGYQLLEGTIITLHTALQIWHSSKSLKRFGQSFSTSLVFLLLISNTWLPALLKFCSLPTLHNYSVYNWGIWLYEAYLLIKFSILGILRNTSKKVNQRVAFPFATHKIITRQSQLKSSERGTENVTGDCHVPAVPPASSSDASKVPNRVNFCWGPDVEKLFINYCVKHLSYKKTKGSNKEQKWTLVRADCWPSAAFRTGRKWRGPISGWSSIVFSRMSRVSMLCHVKKPTCLAFLSMPATCTTWLWASVKSWNTSR